MCTICSQMDPTRMDCAYFTGFVAKTVDEVSASSAGTTAQLADFLVDGYWGGARRAFVQSDITVDVSALTAAGQRLARAAMEAWEMVADITFTEVRGSADITFDDYASGAGTAIATIGTEIVYSETNISSSWLGTYGTEYDSYSLQTYIHELGHALGLGHQGAYNNGATYGRDETFANDSWQMSVMSYFSQSDNTSVNASFAYVVTPMMADIVAIQTLYGAPDAGSPTAGNSTWGATSNLGGYLETLFGLMFDGTGNPALYYGDPVALTIYDVSGNDTLDLTPSTDNNSVSLVSGSFSSIGGLRNNVGITADTVIENARGGSGNDRIIGNAVANLLQGNGGNDTIVGGAGNDTLYGSTGDDTLKGEGGADTLGGGSGNDQLWGGGAADLVFAGAGHDTVGGGDGHDDIWAGQGDDLIYGGTGNDTIGAGHGADRAWTSEGADLVYGGDGNDALGGGASNDTLWGGDDDDALYGGADDDALYGGAGNDNLWGTEGNDTLTGGAGNDTLGGGGGADVLVFAAGSGMDTVVGFADDVDTLRLNDNLWGGTLTAAQVVARYAATSGTVTVFDFGNGDTITLNGIADASALIDDITIV